MKAFMKKKMWCAWAVLLTVLPQYSTAQERDPDYLQAEKFTLSKLNTLLFSTAVDAHWLRNGTEFWYTYKTSAGTQYYLVNPSSGSQKPLFDLADIAARVTEIVGDPFDSAHLPIQELKASEDSRKFTFQIQSTKDEVLTEEDKKKGKKAGKKIFYFEYDRSTKALKHLTDKTKEPDALDWANVSPDGKTVVYAKDYNLFTMPIGDYRKLQKDEKDSTVVETQLTTDGVLYFGYGVPSKIKSTEKTYDGKRRRVWGAWSPDSRHFVVEVEDERRVKDLWVIDALTEPRPTLETYRYHMAGEAEAPQVHLHLFDMQRKQRKVIRTEAWKDQTLSVQTEPFKQVDRDAEFYPLVWLGNNEMFYLYRYSRDLHRIDLCTYTVGQDSIVPIVKERMNTYQETRPVYTLNGGKEVVVWSERDGWAHLYLYDNKGKLLQRLTQGEWHVERILKIDPKTRTVYFVANGRDKKENPYYQHVYSVGLNGHGLKQLTKGNFFHQVQMSDDGRYFVDNYSRINTVPEAVVIDQNGRKVMHLQTSDFSQLFAAGYKFPEPFVVKAADGITDLYGVMYKPFNFDSTKVYPIVDYVYPGPQVEAVFYPFTRMHVRTDRLAQAGFIVISVGQRGGHPARSKWYHNFGYGNMRDYPLADHKSAIEKLAATRPYMNIDKVGIHGHSGGGFMSTAAICTYPDFFKAAVSAAGNHDNGIYNRWWSETHHGVKETIGEKGDTTFVYSITTNPQIAHNLKGHLMLVHGDTDDNVHIANTIRVSDALIKAGKRFDMLYLPSQRHSFKGEYNEYFYWRLVDFFSEHLKGKREKSVDIPKR